MCFVKERGVQQFVFVKNNSETHPFPACVLFKINLLICVLLQNIYLFSINFCKWVSVKLWSRLITHLWKRMLIFGIWFCTISCAGKPEILKVFPLRVRLTALKFPSGWCVCGLFLFFKQSVCLFVCLDSAILFNNLFFVSFFSYYLSLHLYILSHG